jgi:hypothetical protein
VTFAETGLLEIGIPASVEFIGEYCFPRCVSLTSLTFESGSKLSRIEKETFAETGLHAIVIPESVEFLGEGCFAQCRSLLSVSFESGSR